MLRSIGKQSGESVVSVLAKKMKAAVGRICRKRRFIYLFIIKSYTKYYMTDRHTIRTMKAVKASIKHKH